MTLFRASRALTPRLSAYGQYDYLRDAFAGIEHRNSLEGGLSFLAVDTAVHKLRLDGGLGYTNEQRVIGDDVSTATGTLGAALQAEVLGERRVRGRGPVRVRVLRQRELALRQRRRGLRAPDDDLLAEGVVHDALQQRPGARPSTRPTPSRPSRSWRSSPGSRPPRRACRRHSRGSRPAGSRVRVRGVAGEPGKAVAPSRAGSGV